MLSEKELDQRAVELADAGRITMQQNKAMTAALANYDSLVQEYKRLKSDYEEERNSRERYKQMAKGQERNPFVLVLVDGDGYVFDNDLISSGAEGGLQAAGLLDEAIKRSLCERDLEDCRIMVRVYANLVGLSKSLAKVNASVGKEKRSLASFAANFTRSNDLYDFVDAGEVKENAEVKVRGLFKLFVNNGQCKHIYFAACHDGGYIDDLMPYASHRERITLVRNAAFHPQFAKLGLRIEEFPGIFRTTPLEGQAMPMPFSGSPAVKGPTAPSSVNVANNAEPDAKACVFFSKGLCKYGKSCRNLHIKPTTNSSHTTSGVGNFNDIKNWREARAENQNAPSFQVSNLAKHDNNFFKAAGVPNSAANFAHSAAHVQDHVRDQIDFASVLPRQGSTPEGKIPVNKNQQRLDAYIAPPSPHDYEVFKARTSVRKLCNNYHVGGHCPQGDACNYDHGPASEGIINALKQVVFANPCPRKGYCRRPKCLYGHVCQKADCTYRGGKNYCKFLRAAHSQPLELAGLADADAPSARNHKKEESSSGTPDVPSESASEGNTPSPSTSPHDGWGRTPVAPSNEWDAARATEGSGWDSGRAITNTNGAGGWGLDSDAEPEYDHGASLETGTELD